MSFIWYYDAYDISNAILDLDPDLYQNFLFFVTLSILHIQTCMLHLKKAVLKGFIGRLRSTCETLIQSAPVFIRDFYSKSFLLLITLVRVVSLILQQGLGVYKIAAQDQVTGRGQVMLHSPAHPGQLSTSCSTDALIPNIRKRNFLGHTRTPVAGLKATAHTIIILPYDTYSYILLF